MITQAELKEILHYDPETGLFTWLKSGHGIRYGAVAGCVGLNGYIQTKVNKKQYTAHRLAWLYMAGKWPKVQIDHINHVRHDNRWVNLREVTHKENHKNQSLGKNNISGIAGVCWSKQESKWESRIKVDGFPFYLGHFRDKFEAICARKSAENKYGFHENHGR